MNIETTIAIVAVVIIVATIAFFAGMANGTRITRNIITENCERLGGFHDQGVIYRCSAIRKPDVIRPGD